MRFSVKKIYRYYILIYFISGFCGAELEVIEVKNSGSLLVLSRSNLYHIERNASGNMEGSDPIFFHYFYKENAHADILINNSTLASVANTDRYVYSNIGAKGVFFGLPGRGKQMGQLFVLYNQSHFSDNLLFFHRVLFEIQHTTNAIELKLFKAPANLNPNYIYQLYGPMSIERLLLSFSLYDLGSQPIPIAETFFEMYFICLNDQIKANNNTYWFIINNRKRFGVQFFNAQIELSSKLAQKIQSGSWSRENINKILDYISYLRDIASTTSDKNKAEMLCKTIKENSK